MAEIVTLEQRALRALRYRDDLPEEVQLLRASDIPATPIRWLWKGWMAKGKLHILAGAPGTGKTTIALALAAAVTRGASFPDGTQGEPGNVLIWSGEDDPADTLVPRLMAAGADLQRICIIGNVGQGQDARPFDPAQDIGKLEYAAAQFGDISLVIADPVVSAVTGDSHKNTEVRRALQPVVDLGRRLDCAVVGISHFSKGTSGRDPLERVTGSVAFGALARVVLVTAKGDDGTRLLARAKSNIGPDGDGFTYRLELVESEGMEASRVEWGEALTGSARDLLGDAEAGDSSLDDAAAWLEDMLAGTEVRVTELKKQAQAAGYSWRTMERAKASLGFLAWRINGETRGSGHWVWSRKEQAATNKAAKVFSRIGGLEEVVAPQGFDDGSSFKAAIPQSGGVDQRASPTD